MASLRPLLQPLARFSRSKRCTASIRESCFTTAALGGQHNNRTVGVRRSSSSSSINRSSTNLMRTVKQRKQQQQQPRGISSTSSAWHGDHEEGFEHAQTVEIAWVSAKGSITKTQAKCGMNLMRVAHAHGIDLEGACEGVCACSTCHVIVSGEVFDDLPEASEDEEDMLDLAFGLTETSRLGCQVTVTPDMDGIVVKLPAATRNFYVDGHVPQPH